MDVNTDTPLTLVVLISGGGSNLQSIIDHIQTGSLNAELLCVVSDQADAGGLQRAKHAGIATRVIQPSSFSDREAFDSALLDTLNGLKPDLVVLAGFMRILGSAIVNAFRNRMINIHPSLLPAFAGLNTHQRAIDAKHSVHGASVHFVTTELDGGPIIEQRKVPVLAEDTAQSLQRRVLAEEHIMLPEVIQWVAEGRLAIENGRVLKDGHHVRFDPAVANE